MALTLFFIAAAQAQAQTDGPWGVTMQRMEDVFTGTIARALSAVGIVVGGLNLIYGENGHKRIVAGLVFGCGMCLLAKPFLAWITGTP
jgi:type IV secretory pathway VirB2 component (pilin)